MEDILSAVFHVDVVDAGGNVVYVDFVVVVVVVVFCC